MPLEWRTYHAARLVHVTAKGAIGLADLEPFMSALEAQGILAYRKLIDARSATPSLRADDFAPFFTYLVRCSARTPLGPLAWVNAHDGGLSGMFSQRMTLVPRPFRTFRDLEEAKLWLSRMPIEV